ncbi:MAG: hypothetical protein EAZ30_00845 [Betaproteobacteria bacterium]|nr:MAG: hypothetical protein EAZ30_00845 [Betaproteobacteria bacterium]
MVRRAHHERRGIGAFAEGIWCKLAPWRATPFVVSWSNHERLGKSQFCLGSVSILLPLWFDGLTANGGDRRIR